MSSSVYDFAIVGAGAAGLQLAAAMTDDPYFSEKRILILDPSEKDENDRTWCFWEQGEGKWDSIIFRKWKKAAFNTAERKMVLDLEPYSYKMLRAIDFYQYVRELLATKENVTWIRDEVSQIGQGMPHLIHGSAESYEAKMVFDSRVHPDFYANRDKSVRILQHFAGWVIETPEDTFDPEVFVMMDFSVKWPESTSFTYILPFSRRKALVEFTLFSPSLLRDEDYEEMLRKYISKELRLDSYEIVEEEKGIIPMSDYPFHKINSDSHIRIGTAGSWVKPSSGYSFHNAGKYAARIVENLKNNSPATQGIGSLKYRLYDSIFLEVLYHQNELGEEIFSDMYQKNPTSRIFKFLDEETSIGEDLKIITSFRSAPFTRALLRTIRR